MITPEWGRAGTQTRLRIGQITLREIQLRLKRPFRISSGEVQSRRILLLELQDVDGVVGWSECVAAEWPNYSPETVDTAWVALRNWIFPRLLNRDLDGPHAVRPLLEAAIRGHPMAKAAAEMGIWELHARRLGEPLATILGGSRRRIPVGISLGIKRSPAALVDEATSASAAGYRKIKIKIEPGADLAFLSAVREALGPDAPLMADANSAYSLEDAPHLAKMDPLNLLMIEQPLDRTDLVRHARLRRLIRTPICIDESVDCPARAEDMIDLGSGEIINIKPGRVGGFASSLAIHDICREHNVPVWCGGMLESGIGRAHNVALASLPNFTIPGDLSPSARYWEQDIVDPEWTMDDEGMVEVPLDRSGMGVDVNVDRIHDLTVRSETVTAR